MKTVDNKSVIHAVPFRCENLEIRKDLVITKRGYGN
jgi:hypothetical protein